MKPITKNQYPSNAHGYFIENSINIWIPLLAVDFENGRIVNTNTKSAYTFPPLPDFLLKLLDVGLIENTKRKLKR